MKAVLTVVGNDRVGILAAVSSECAKYNVNVLEVSQSILQKMFCMIMVVDVSDVNVEFGVFCDKMSEMGTGIDMVIHVMHEDIFNSMHRI